MLNIWRALLHEKRCLACGQPFLPPEEQNKKSFFIVSASPAAYFCSDCLKSLPVRTAGYCPYCGYMGPDPTLPSAPCGACLKKQPAWDTCVFYGEYKGLLRDLLKRFKFNSQVFLRNGLSALLFQQVKRTIGLEIDLIVPIPLHTRRLQHRGYNQALLLAQGLQKLMQHTLMEEADAYNSSHEHLVMPELYKLGLVRARHTQPQVGLSKEERFANTQGIFTALPVVTGKKVLLVDDIYTTGATMYSACDVLLAAGAKRVSVAVVAHT